MLYRKNSKRLWREIFKNNFQKILKGIKYCHENKKCHLDIKPGNILLDNNYKPKIIDFSLSDYFNEPDEEPIYDISTRGSIRYVCPEMYDKENHHFSGVKADIFSFGVLLLNLVPINMVFYFQKRLLRVTNILLKESMNLFGILLKQTL